jgi:L-amino acid N-acyltransferase YncA
MGSGQGTAEAEGEAMSGAATLSAVQAATVQFEIRPLTGDDSNAYRALRQRILDIGDGRYFSDSYEREAKLTTPQLWGDWCTEKREHCIMGTFADKQLVGVMMITQQGDAKSPVVEWEATWLHPDYRMGGVARMAYQRVHDWTVQQGYRYAAVFIREDNCRSQDIRTRQGFQRVYTIPNETWADGSVASTHAYVLDLRAPPDRAAQRLKTIDHLAEAIAYLQTGLHAAPSAAPDRSPARPQLQEAQRAVA